jgi:hypothetical protein
MKEREAKYAEKFFTKKKHKYKLPAAHDCHLLVNHGSSSRCSLGNRIDIHIMSEQA